jgi:sigma-B regulation protein RsbU (phosphoserine phosphatase)
MPRTEILAFIAAISICLAGLVALAVYVLRFRSKERDLLWIGLFAALYGADLALRNPIFQLSFGISHEIFLFAPRILNACSIVPALLLFEEFYGRGWHSLLHWVIVGYAVVATGVYGFMFVHSRPELIPSAATTLVVCVPLVLVIGRVFRYQPPRLEHAKVLFAGLLCFFLAFSIDRLRSLHAGQWKPGLEPYGFIVLLGCLSVVATQRILADDRRLMTLTDEMHAAAAIQASILPQSVPTLDRARIAVRYIPMSVVAGDFYDFPMASPDSVDILIADVMGHGVPAALVASMVKVAVHARAGEPGHPGRVIESLNSILCDEAPGQFVTAAYFHLDLSIRSGSYSAAAHPPPLLWSRARQQLVTLQGGGLLLGVRKHERYRSFQFPLESGDRILLYTDGLTEAENANEEPFGDRALPAFFARQQDLNADEFAQSLQEKVLNWSRQTRRGPADDITFVVIDILPPG